MADPRRRLRRAALPAALSALALVAVLAGGWRGPAAAQASPVDSGPVAQLFALRLPDADGREQPLSQWRGRVLVVNFWATWCAPCVAEMPALQKLQAEYGARGVTILGLGTESQAKVQGFRDHHALRLTLLAGGYDALAIARNLGDTQGVLPYTAVFSADGVLLHTQLGALKDGQLRGWLLEAMARTDLRR
jgi:thiol-disulfide isomerase/thioredoxin